MRDVGRHSSTTFILGVVATEGGSAMRVKLKNALVVLEKAAAVVAIVVPAVRGVASIMGVNLAETK